MKKTIAFLLVSICFCNCGEKKEAIDFITLNGVEFNAKPFEMPDVKVMDSLKRAHDSCMGFSFNANAFLVGRVDFLIGSIVNKQSLKMVGTIADLGLTDKELISKLNIISKPCYEKRILHVPLKTMLGRNFTLDVPNTDEALNKEIHDAISASGDVEMQTGSWTYIDIQNGLKKLLDTAKSVKLLHYKDNLLDSSNMVLTSAESISNVSFIITTKNDISESLQVLLKRKPSFSLSSSPILQVSVQLFYIDSNKFQMTFNGFFPVAGKFMKVQYK
jgi:hypothetical protein